MPSTVPSHVPVARKESRPGISMIRVASLPSSEPIDSTENGALDVVSYSPSAAAIFIGCTSVMILPWMSPVTTTPREATSAMTAPKRVAVRYIGSSSVPACLRTQPERDAHDDGPTDHVGGGDDVRERHELDLVGQHRHEVGHLGATVLGVEPEADRVLHERVRREDEVGRQHGADVHEPHRAGVELLGDAAPAEDPDAEEGRLEEEREQGLEGQGRPEDVADEPRVVRPVHPELELLHDARDEPEREVDDEQLPEELREPEYSGFLVRSHWVWKTATTRDSPIVIGHEEEVVDGRDGELPPGDIDGIHAGSREAEDDVT